MAYVKPSVANQKENQPKESVMKSKIHLDVNGGYKRMMMAKNKKYSVPRSQYYRKF